MWIDDQILRRCSEQLVCDVWIPDQTTVVLGASNDPETEAHVDHCAEDGVPILKRYGGGGAVVLYDGCVVISIGCWVRQFYQNRLYFERISGALGSVLEAKILRGKKISQRGISDLCIDDRKIAGTSLFRSRNYLLYQASLIVDADHEKISHYLKHPSREPDYRAGRTHKDFVGGLASFCTGQSIHDIFQLLSSDLTPALQRALDAELIDPQETQFAGILKRAQS